MLQLSVSRLKRIVPIAVAVGRQIRVMEEIRPNILDFLPGMLHKGYGLLGKIERMPMGVGYIFSQNTVIPGCGQIIAKYLERPDDNIAMAFFLLHVCIVVEHAIAASFRYPRTSG